jgi:hypothetical protein
MKDLINALLKKLEHLQHGCSCGGPSPDDMLLLSMVNPISNGATTRGFVRLTPDGGVDSGSSEAPFGYVIPAGRRLVVTDLAYFSGFTSPGAENDLLEIRFAILTEHPGGGFSQIPVFVATTRFAHDGSVGGNVAMHTGFVVNHGHFLTATILQGSDLIATQLYVYGYLARD